MYRQSENSNTYLKYISWRILFLYKYIFNTFKKTSYDNVEMCMELHAEDFHPNKAVKITLDKIENLYLKLALKNIY